MDIRVINTLQNGFFLQKPFCFIQHIYTFRDLVFNIRDVLNWCTHLKVQLKS